MTREPSPGGAREPPHRLGAGHGLRIAARSSGDELHPGWAWGLTAVVVLAAGVTLYAARAAIGTTLDRWLPRLERTATEARSEAPIALDAPESGREPPAEPEWTFVDVEAAIRPLPELAATLIAEGRSEMSEFSDLDSAAGSRALAIRHRWRLWGRVWKNRVGQIRAPMPPPRACEPHAALEPTCRAIRESLVLLDRVPSAGSAGDARRLFDAAAAILDRLRRSQAEPEGEAGSPPE